jgi:hypothetical protein
MKIFIRHNLQIQTSVDSRISQIPDSGVSQVHDSGVSRVPESGVSRVPDSRVSQASNILKWVKIPVQRPSSAVSFAHLFVN